MEFDRFAGHAICPVVSASERNACGRDLYQGADEPCLGIGESGPGVEEQLFL
jgi:hypothetical protein